MARGGGRPRPERQGAPRHLQRDHRTRDPRGVREPEEHRPEPGRCAADATDRRPSRRLHPQPAPLAQGPRRPVGRPRPVGRRAARCRAGARDHRVRRARVLDARGDPVDGGRGALRRRARPHRRGAAERRRCRNRRAPRDRAARHASSRHEDRDAHPEAPTGAPVHDLHAAAGGEPQARLQPEADDVDRPAPVRGRRHARRPRRPDHVHANRFDGHGRRGDGRGTRRHRVALRRPVHDAQGPRVQDEGEGRPGGARVDPPDELRTRPRLAGAVPQAGGAAPVPAHLAARDRLADGGQGARDDDGRPGGWAVRAARQRDANAVRRVRSRLHRGP